MSRRRKRISMPVAPARLVLRGQVITTFATSGVLPARPVLLGQVITTFKTSGILPTNALLAGSSVDGILSEFIPTARLVITPSFTESY